MAYNLIYHADVKRIDFRNNGSKKYLYSNRKAQRGKKMKPQNHAAVKATTPIHKIRLEELTRSTRLKPGERLMAKFFSQQSRHI